MAAKKAKKAAPAKKAPSARKKSSDDSGENPYKSEYFIQRGKAYVRVPSGDVLGPYDKGTAAYNETIRMSGRFGGGLTNRGK